MYISLSLLTADYAKFVEFYARHCAARLLGCQL